MTSKARQQLGPPTLRVICMGSKADEDRVYSITLNGYMIGYPVSLESAQFLREWFENGALREIDNLYSEDK